MRHSDRASEGLRDLLERRRGRRRVDGHSGAAEPRRGMPKMRGRVFDTPQLSLTSYEMAGAATLDSRRASKRNRSEPGEWSDCANRGFASRVRKCGWHRTG